MLPCNVWSPVDTRNLIVTIIFTLRILEGLQGQGKHIEYISMISLQVFDITSKNTANQAASLTTYASKNIGDCNRDGTLVNGTESLIMMLVNFPKYIRMRRPSSPHCPNFGALVADADTVNAAATPTLLGRFDRRRIADSQETPSQEKDEYIDQLKKSVT